LIVEPGWRWAWVARLKSLRRESNPPCIASTRPVLGSSARKPPCTSGTVRTAQALPLGEAAVTSPTLIASGKPTSGASLPSAKPIVADSPARAVTTPTRQFW